MVETIKSLKVLKLFFRFKSAFEKKLIFFIFLLQINIFLVFLDHFNALISKIIFKK